MSEAQPVSNPAAGAPPFDIHNGGGEAAMLVVCDHAGRAIPPEYGSLGVAEEKLGGHIAWDIGAGALTRRLADQLGACAVVARYSRLVVDLNRGLDHPTLMVARSDGIEVPGNRDLDPTAIERRLDLYYRPYHQAVAERLARLKARYGAPALIGIHSFTPVMNGVERPWQVGLLWNKDRRLVDPMLAALAGQDDVMAAENEPYSGRTTNHTMDIHGTDHGLPNLSIEVRQDLIDSSEGALRWAEILAVGLRLILGDSSLLRVEMAG